MKTFYKSFSFILPTLLFVASVLTAVKPSKAGNDNDIGINIDRLGKTHAILTNVLNDYLEGRIENNQVFVLRLGTGLNKIQNLDAEVMVILWNTAYMILSQRSIERSDIDINAIDKFFQDRIKASLPNDTNVKRKTIRRLITSEIERGKIVFERLIDEVERARATDAWPKLSERLLIAPESDFNVHFFSAKMTYLISLAERRGKIEEVSEFREDIKKALRELSDAKRRFSSLTGLATISIDQDTEIEKIQNFLSRTEDREAAILATRAKGREKQEKLEAARIEIAQKREAREYAKEMEKKLHELGFERISNRVADFTEAQKEIFIRHLIAAIKRDMLAIRIKDGLFLGLRLLDWVERISGLKFFFKIHALLAYGDNPSPPGFFRFFALLKT